MDRGGPSNSDSDHDIVEEALALMLRIATAAAQARDQPSMGSDGGD